MEWFSAVDWGTLFTPDTPLLEIFVRGSVIYLSLFFLLRVVLKRQGGEIGLSDLLVIVLVADAAQNGMAGDYKSIPDGILLVATLIFWDYALDWFSYHFAWFDRLVCPPPLLLISNGKFQRNNMRKELITEDDLMSQLRQQGVDNVARVKKAYVEGDGKISVIENKRVKRPPKEQETTV